MTYTTSTTEPYSPADMLLSFSDSTKTSRSRASSPDLEGAMRSKKVKQLDHVFRVIVETKDGNLLFIKNSGKLCLPSLPTKDPEVFPYKEFKEKYKIVVMATPELNETVETSTKITHYVTSHWVKSEQESSRNHITIKIADLMKVIQKLPDADASILKRLVNQRFHNQSIIAKSITFPLTIPLPSQQVNPYITDCKNLAGVLEHILTHKDEYKNSLLILDIDDTLVGTQSYLPSYIHPMISKKISGEIKKKTTVASFKKTQPQYLSMETQDIFHDLMERTGVYHLKNAILIEKEIPTLLRDIQEAGIAVVGCTHRNPKIADETEALLKGLGIDFQKQTPLSSYSKSYGENPYLMKNGILYCRDPETGEGLSNKAVCIDSAIGWMKESEQPQTLVFVDDLQENITSFEEQFSKGFTLQLFRYLLFCDRVRWIHWEDPSSQAALALQTHHFVHSPESPLDFG